MQINIHLVNSSFWSPQPAISNRESISFKSNHLPNLPNQIKSNTAHVWQLLHRATSNELSVVLLFLSRSFSCFQLRVYLAFDVRNSQLAFEISHELNVVFYCTIIKSRNVMGHRNKANHPLLPFVAELNQ